MFRPSDEAVFTTLGVNTHLFTCEPSELDSLVRTGLKEEPAKDQKRQTTQKLWDVLCVCAQLPLPEEIHWSPGDSKLHDMSAEEVANQLVAFDWELFSCVHEVGDITSSSSTCVLDPHLRVWCRWSSCVTFSTVSKRAGAP